MDTVELDLSGADTRISRSTLAAQLEEAIRLDIISGALEPGLRLRASDLTKRYGVSATPLREALQRLAAQNLVELGPRLGATVAPISKPELEDIYWLREQLEGVALQRSVQRSDPEWERRVTEAFRAFEQTQGTGPATSRADALAWSAVHRAFHDSLYDNCNSPWLLRFISVLGDHSERYRMVSMRRGVRHSLQEHRDIFDAAMARDEGAATAALMRHLAGTVDVLEQALPGLQDH